MWTIIIGVPVDKLKKLFAFRKIDMIFSTLRCSNYSINIENGSGCWAEERHFTIKPYNVLFQFSISLSTKSLVCI